MKKSGEDFLGATDFCMPSPSNKAKPNKSVNLSNPTASYEKSADFTGVDMDSKPKASNESDSPISKPSVGGKYDGRGEGSRFSNSYE